MYDKIGELKMEQINIVSTNIKSIYYIEEKEQMYIFFLSNHLYVYNVKKTIYNNFKKSKNKNLFFIENIKNSCTFSRIY